MSKVQFNCELFKNDKVTVETGAVYSGQHPIWVEAFEDGESSLVRLSYDDAMAMGIHLIALATPHGDPAVIADYHAAMAKEAASLVPSAAPKPRGYRHLTPLAQTLVQHMRRAGSISAREAMNDYGIMAGSLTRRLTDIEEAGFKVKRDRKVHPITQRPYTRYSLADMVVTA